MQTAMHRVVFFVMGLRTEAVLHLSATPQCCLSPTHQGASASLEKEKMMFPHNCPGACSAALIVPLTEWDEIFQNLLRVLCCATLIIAFIYLFTTQSCPHETFILIVLKLIEQLLHARPIA